MTWFALLGMAQVDIHVATAHPSRLLGRVAPGEEIVISRPGKGAA